MPTLEPAYEQAEEILFAAIEDHQLDPELAAWADAIYRNAQTWALIIYAQSRLVGSRIYEPEKAAIFWKGQLEWANTSLETLRRTEQRFITRGVATPPALVAAVQTAKEILEAFQDACELSTRPETSLADCDAIAAEGFAILDEAEARNER